MSYFGGLFPDGVSAAVETPAVAASLSLADPTTISSALQNVTIRARTLGTPGNVIRFNIDVGTLADGGEIQESGNDVTLLFNDGDLASDIFATINATSTLVEAVGFVNPGETMIEGEDNFDRLGGPGAFIDLEGGVNAVLTANNGFWDGHFPDAADAGDTPTIPPSTPEGVATLALRLENGLRVTYAWSTGIFKSFDGKEQRESLLDDPSASFAGSALLVGTDPVSIRAALAQHAANGAVFSLALPYEMTTVVDVDASEVTLGTPTTSIDWAVFGQRVLVLHGAGDDIEAITGVVQEVGASTLVLDPLTAPVSPGSVIMPLVPVLLEAEQSFARHRVNAERWQLNAQAAVFGFPSSASPGELTITGGALDGVTLRAATPGITVRVALESGGPVEVELAVTPVGVDGDFDLLITVPTGGTVGDMQTALVGVLTMVGITNDDLVITAGDEFALTALTGEDATSYGEMGRGATVTTLLGRPLWDRKLENPSTITDSIHSMTAIEDLGAQPFGIVEGEIPDGGRHIRHTSKEWQWFKAFLSAVKGQWKSFWLPTGRADLVVTADAAATTLFVDAEIGSYEMWAARGYSVLEVVQSGVLRFVQVTGDSEASGVLTLTVTGDALTAGPVDRISWCELVHLESDKVDVAFDSGGNFQVAMTARVVQQ